MAVRRIVSNLWTAEPEKARRFYGEILGLSVLMGPGGGACGGIRAGGRAMGRAPLLRPRSLRQTREHPEPYPLTLAVEDRPAAPAP